MSNETEWALVNAAKASLLALVAVAFAVAVAGLVWRAAGAVRPSGVTHPASEGRRGTVMVWATVTAAVIAGAILATIAGSDAGVRTPRSYRGSPIMRQLVGVASVAVAGGMITAWLSWKKVTPVRVALFAVAIAAVPAGWFVFQYLRT